MKVYNVRHGETDWNKDRRLQGRSDIELNEYGIQLAELTRDGLKDIKFDYIFSSPLKRAYRTAEIIRGDRNLPIVTDERLVEIAFGINEGIPSDKMPEDFHLFFDSPLEYVPAEGGETYGELCARSEDFARKVLQPLSIRRPDANVLLVAHGAFNKSLMVYLGHRELREIWRVFPKNCSMNIYDVNGDAFNLEKENLTFY
ncbi:MAG: histidine phosphatase family protein [Lachnospiraceae bacterium]|nr:histidine phosphatase family protein [Lachnospiraceae bacterium]